MNLRFWRYELIPRARLSAIVKTGPRQGALIRAGDGFADVHPWTELGDRPLGEQLALLARGELTPLTTASLQMARLDGEARARGENLFRDMTIPPGHHLVLDDVVPPGFDTVKVKMGPDSDPRRLESLSHLQIRLDFNGTLDGLSFERVATLFPRRSIDFIEDPCPYDPVLWGRLRHATGYRLARDRGDAYEGADVAVIKPAVQDVDEALAAAGDREIVITSYMDHPVGQLGAAWYAARHAARIRRCGVITHTLFEPDAFLDRMRVEGARLVPPAGTGVGFDDLLEALPWERLR